MTLAAVVDVTALLDNHEAVTGTQAGELVIWSLKTGKVGSCDDELNKSYWLRETVAKDVTASRNPTGINRGIGCFLKGADLE